MTAGHGAGVLAGPPLAAPPRQTGPEWVDKICVGDPRRCYDIDCCCCLACVFQRNPEDCTCPVDTYSLLGRDLWRGLNAWHDEVAYAERVAALWHLQGDDPERVLLLPGFDQSDLRESVDRLDGRDARRLPALLGFLYDQHEARHFFFSHPHCPGCFDEGTAARRLTRWLLVNPGRTPRDAWDGTIPAPTLGTRHDPTFLTLSELRRLPPAEWQFAEIVPQGSLGYITGRDGVWKTFLALDLVLHLINGMDWNGRPLHFGGYGRALFVAGEGVRSFSKRIDAWVDHHGIEHEVRRQTGTNPATGLATYEPTGDFRSGLDPLLQEPNLVVRNGAVDLYAGAEAFAGLLAKVHDLAPDLLVIDTLARSAGAAEQNSASDMSVITARIGALKAAAGDHCTVLVVAHTDKGDNDARGSSSIEDDADFILHMRKADADRARLTVAKMKDGESGQSIELQALPVGGSLVLTEPRADAGLRLSDSLAERVKAVLFAVRGQDKPTAAQLLALVTSDGTGKPVSRAALYGVLGDLTRAGVLLAEKANDRPTTASHYSLDRSQWPSDVTE